MGGWVIAALVATMTVALSRTRRESVARACHELRGPITAARLGLSLSERAGELPAERLRAIDIELRRASLALDDLAAVAPGRPTGPGGRPRDLDEVMVGRLVADCRHAAAGRAAAAGVALRGSWAGPEAIVWGDRLRLAQALGNLLANAIEHGGGEVAIQGSVAGRFARIAVCDRGPGLPAPVAELARRPRAGRGARGRGIAIALGIVRAHGGRLSAAPGRVLLELPLAADARDPR